MSAYNYGRLKATADRLIGRFGRSGTLSRPGSPTGPAYDPTPGTPTTYAVSYVVDDYRNSELDGTRVLQSDKKLTMAVKALSITPATSDTLVETDGSVYKIIDVKPLQPGATTLLWEIQARR